MRHFLLTVLCAVLLSGGSHAAKVEDIHDPLLAGMESTNQSANWMFDAFQYPTDTNMVVVRLVWAVPSNAVSVASRAAAITLPGDQGDKEIPVKKGDYVVEFTYEIRGKAEGTQFKSVTGGKQVSGSASKIRDREYLYYVTDVQVPTGWYDITGNFKDVAAKLDDGQIRADTKTLSKALRPYHNGRMNVSDITIARKFEQLGKPQAQAYKSDGSRKVFLVSDGEYVEPALDNTVESGQPLTFAFQVVNLSAGESYQDRLKGRYSYMYQFVSLVAGPDGKMRATEEITGEGSKPQMIISMPVEGTEFFKPGKFEFRFQAKDKTDGSRTTVARKVFTIK